MDAMERKRRYEALLEQETEDTNTDINKEETIMENHCTPKINTLLINYQEEFSRGDCSSELIVIPGGHYGIDYIEGIGYRLLEDICDMGKQDPESEVLDTFDTLIEALAEYNHMALGDHICPEGLDLYKDKVQDMASDLTGLVSTAIAMVNRPLLIGLHRHKGLSWGEILKAIQEALLSMQEEWAPEAGRHLMSLSKEETQDLKDFLGEFVYDTKGEAYGKLARHFIDKI